MGGITLCNSWIMPNQEQRVQVWCVAISPARSGRLMSVFVSDNSPTAGATPRGANKDPKKRDEERVRSRGRGSAPAFFSSSFFFFFFSSNADSLFYAQLKHKWLSHQYSQPGPLPAAVSLPPVCSRLFLSHFSHFAYLFQPTSNSPAERCHILKNERMK